MEDTEEGRQVAASVRLAAKRAHAAQAAADEEAKSSKRAPGPAAKGPATTTHEVAIPEGYDVEAAAEKLDPEVYGGIMAVSLF
jgi:hypothetical protein